MSLPNESSTLAFVARLRESVSLKMAVIGFLILLLLIPVGMLRGIVEERSQLRYGVAREVLRGWGGAQLVAGPMLVVPATTFVSDARERRLADSRLHVLPGRLDVDAVLEPSVLYRGIHEVPVYRARVRITGTIPVPARAPGALPIETLATERASVVFAMSDAGAAHASPVLVLDGREIPFEPGGTVVNGWPPVMTARVGDVLAAAEPGALLPFGIELDFNGGESLQFLPLGDTTTVNMASTWPAPSFTGYRLPRDREVREDGFTAAWSTSGFGRPLPSTWLDGTVDVSLAMQSAFGVSLHGGVDLYQKTLRATKYALLFIGLSFLACFLFETMGRFVLHPLQYLLIGFANALFYLLLLSLTEHVGFGLAYMASSFASIALIAGYCRSVLGSVRRASLMALLLAALYGFLYLVLQSEDYAMLAGALGLWGILGSIMYFTRGVDWYRPGADTRT